MLKKIAARIAVLLVVTQIVFIVLQVMEAWDLPVLLLLAPFFWLAVVFIVGYVLWAEKKL